MGIFEQLKQKTEELKTMGKGSPVLLHSYNIGYVRSSGEWPISVRVAEKDVSGFLMADKFVIRGHFEAVPFAGYKDVEPNYGYIQIGNQGDYVTVYLDPKDLEGIQIEGFQPDKKTGYLKGRVRCGELENHSLGKSYTVPPISESLKLQNEFKEEYSKLGIPSGERKIKSFRENVQLTLYQLEKLEPVCQEFSQKYMQKYMELPQEERESDDGQYLKKRIEAVQKMLKLQEAECEVKIQNDPTWGFVGMHSMIVKEYGEEEAKGVCRDIIYRLQDLEWNNQNVNIDWEYVYEQIKEDIGNHTEFSKDGYTNLKPIPDKDMDENKQSNNYELSGEKESKDEPDEEMEMDDYER